MEGLPGQVLTGVLWSLAIFDEGRQYWVFHNNGTLASERVPVFKFQLCPSFWFRVYVGEGVRLWFWVQLEVCSLL